MDAHGPGVGLDGRLREPLHPFIPGELRVENAEKFVGMGR